MTRVFAMPLALAATLALAVLASCEPRHKKGAVGPTQSAVVATAPTAAPPPPPPTAAQPGGGGWQIPNIGIPGLPTSPRQALLGKWNVTAVDGKPVATAPGMATDPMDPASYVAGTQVVFTADNVTVSRGGVNLLSRHYTVVSEFPPVRVTIDAGYGPSNVDFGIDGSCLWSLPSTPPHALSLARAQ